jgi:5-methylcytosine-specific restriction endonuclease McrA
MPTELAAGLARRLFHCAISDLHFRVAPSHFRGKSGVGGIPCAILQNRNLRIARVQNAENGLRDCPILNTDFVTRRIAPGNEMPRPLMAPRRKPAVQEISKRQERSSPRLRGYDSKWDRLSAAFRRRNPLCAWCDQIGRVTVADLVDHKMPVADGGPIYDETNLWSVCLPHHGIKAEMENYARQRGELHKLRIWCDEPAERPARFRGGSPS